MQLSCLSCPCSYGVDLFLELQEELWLRAKLEDDLQTRRGRRWEMVKISERNMQKDNKLGQVLRSQDTEAACDSQQ